MFEATIEQRLERLENLFQTTLTERTTPVKSDRSLSAGGSFCTKIRSRINDNTLFTLVSFKQYKTKLRAEIVFRSLSDVYFMFLELLNRVYWIKTSVLPTIRLVHTHTNCTYTKPSV